MKEDSNIIEFAFQLHIWGGIWGSRFTNEKNSQVKKMIFIKGTVHMYRRQRHNNKQSCSPNFSASMTLTAKLCVSVCVCIHSYTFTCASMCWGNPECQPRYNNRIANICFLKFTPPHWNEYLNYSASKSTKMHMSPVGSYFMPIRPCSPQ